jgi:hypothetical protein
MTDEELAKLLMYDPLHEAGRATGRDYKEDPATETLGVLMYLSHSDAKRQALTATEDTTFSEPLGNYIRLITAEGFALVLDVPFVGSENRDEHFYVFFHARDGILLKFDTYGQHVNSGNFYYNWKPSFDVDAEPDKKPQGLTSSGQYTRDTDGRYLWAGHHDCREAVRLHVRRLRHFGEFVTPWRRSPWLWLLHYMDSKVPGYDHAAITKERIALLPVEVRTAIGAVDPVNRGSNG